MGLPFILIESTMFDAGDERTQTEKDLCWWLEALVQRNMSYLKARPSTPRLYKSGVVYSAPKQFSGDVEEVRILKSALGKAARQADVRRALDLIQQVLSGEHFCDIGVILRRGNIDCDGLASYRVAELRQRGIQARPFMTSRTRLDGGTTYHALVRWPPIPTVPYETTEDPSLLLGMGGSARAADRAKEIEKNQERCSILKKYGIQATGSASPLFSDGEDILGLRRPSGAPDAVVAEIDRLLRGAA